VTCGSGRESEDVAALYPVDLAPVLSPAEVSLEEGSSGLFPRVNVPRGGKEGMGSDELFSLVSLPDNRTRH
jgi:hypothetical protein